MHRGHVASDERLRDSAQCRRGGASDRVDVPLCANSSRSQPPHESSASETGRFALDRNHGVNRLLSQDGLVALELQRESRADQRLSQARSQTFHSMRCRAAFPASASTSGTTLPSPTKTPARTTSGLARAARLSACTSPQTAANATSNAISPTVPYSAITSNSELCGYGNGGCSIYVSGREVHRERVVLICADTEHRCALEDLPSLFIDRKSGVDVVRVVDPMREQRALLELDEQRAGRSDWPGRPLLSRDRGGEDAAPGRPAPRGAR